MEENKFITEVEFTALVMEKMGVTEEEAIRMIHDGINSGELIPWVEDNDGNLEPLTPEA